MYCSKCGTQVQDSADFCSSCGNSTKTQQREGSRSKEEQYLKQTADNTEILKRQVKNEADLFWWGAGIFVVVVAGLVLWLSNVLVL